MPASQCIQKHAVGVALIGSDTKVICRLFKVAMFVELDSLGDMFIGRQALVATIGASRLGPNSAF
jgi:hypothetical protein